MTCDNHKAMSCVCSQISFKNKNYLSVWYYKINGFKNSNHLKYYKYSYFSYLERRFFIGLYERGKHMNTTPANSDSTD